MCLHWESYSKWWTESEQLYLLVWQEQAGSLVITLQISQEPKETLVPGPTEMPFFAFSGWAPHSPHTLSKIFVFLGLWHYLVSCENFICKKRRRGTNPDFQPDSSEISQALPSKRIFQLRFTHSSYIVFDFWEVSAHEHSWYKGILGM